MPEGGRWGDAASTAWLKAKPTVPERKRVTNARWREDNIERSREQERIRSQRRRDRQKASITA